MTNSTYEGLDKLNNKDTERNARKLATRRMRDLTN